MKIIIGHTNMDLDCFGSIALIKYLYPEHTPVQSHLVHPAARNLYNLYQNRLKFISSKDLKNQPIEEVIIVDTRSRNRVKEYFDNIKSVEGNIIVYDHHPPGENDVEGATIHYGDYGSNTTFIGLELIKRGIEIDPEDATIALTGIFADTGNFRHENVMEEDFRVASYLIKNGASITLVNKFLETLKDKEQRTLFYRLMNRLTYKEISGNFIILSYVEIDNQVGGLSAVVEKIFDVEQSDAIFCVLFMKKTGDSLIIARSRKDNIDLNQILKAFGGGGHKRAASAMIKDKSGMMVFGTLEEHLKSVIRPASIAEDIMVTNVKVVKDTMTLMEASMFLEEVNHTGAPVLSQRGELVGFVTLYDIMKGRRGKQMHASVKGYMTSKVVSASKDVTIREIEELLFQNNIGHIPIVQGKGLLGLVTRADYLNYMEKERGRGEGVEGNSG